MAPLILAQRYGLAVLQGAQRFRCFNVLRVLPVSLYSISVLVLFLTDSRGLPLIALFLITSMAVSASIALTMAARTPDARGSSHPNFKRRELIRFGLKGFIGSISPVDTFRLDQAVVGLLLSPAGLGLYVVGMAFTNLPRFIAGSIGIVAYPHVANQIDVAAARRSTWRFFWFTLLVCIPVVVLLEAMMGWLIPFFFGAEFADAVGLARILLIAATLMGGRRILVDCTRGAGFPGDGTISEVASAIALIAALVFFTPRYGVTGVAFAMVCSAGTGLAVLLGLTAIRTSVPASNRSMIHDKRS